MTASDWLDVAFRTSPIWLCAVIVAAHQSRVLRMTLWNRLGLREVDDA